MIALNKTELINAFITQLESDIHEVESSLKENREEATHEESKPENEYDTRALEQSYLVKALSKRLIDARDALGAFKSVEPKSFLPDESISATAVIQVEIENKKTWFLYMPSGGGHSVHFNGIKIQVITPTSPLGESLLGQHVGDIVSIENGAEIKDVEILQIL